MTGRRLDPNAKRKKIKERRLVICAELFAKGYTYRQIQEEAIKQLGLKSYSLDTVKRDIDLLKIEWRSTRIESMDDAINSELFKINMQERELWEAWEKSKNDQKLTSSKQKGVASKAAAVGEDGKLTNTNKIITTDVEKTEKDEINYGDPRYQSEITKLGVERRKLIGMYAPEKREVSGTLGFFDFLQQNNTVNE